MTCCLDFHRHHLFSLGQTRRSSHTGVTGNLEEHGVGGVFPKDSLLYCCSGSVLRTMELSSGESPLGGRNGLFEDPVVGKMCLPVAQVATVIGVDLHGGDRAKGVKMG